MLKERVPWFIIKFRMGCPLYLKVCFFQIGMRSIPTLDINNPTGRRLLYEIIGGGGGGGVNPERKETGSVL